MKSMSERGVELPLWAVDSRQWTLAAERRKRRRHAERRDDEGGRVLGGHRVVGGVGGHHTQLLPRLLFVKGRPNPATRGHFGSGHSGGSGQPTIHPQPAP